MLAYLSGPAIENLCDWKLRFKINSEKMLTGSLLQISEVFKQLVRLQAEKPLSFREKKMLDRTRTMLISEVSLARNISASESNFVVGKSFGEIRLCFSRSGYRNGKGSDVAVFRRASVPLLQKQLSLYHSSVSRIPRSKVNFGSCPRSRRAAFVSACESLTSPARRGSVIRRDLHALNLLQHSRA